MSIDPELLKQLIVTFETELQEQSQTVTNCLLSLEKNNLPEEKRKTTIDTIFRAAHNVKGAARSIGINDVGEIAHRLESLFSSIKSKSVTINAELIDLCLDAVDKMRLAMNAFVEKTSLPFDLTSLLQELETGKKQTQPEPKKEKPIVPQKIISDDTESHESIRVAITKIDKISALMEEMQVNKISISESYSSLTQLSSLNNELNQLWKQISLSLENTKINESLQRLLNMTSDHVTEMNTTMQTLHKNMHTRLNELSLLSTSLQEEIRTLRLVPASHLLCTFPRYVRDLANELHKKVELKMKGDEVKMDKMVLEGLKDPIIHLLRNAIDHGIESPDVRQKSGKPEIGTILIDIREEGDQISICISDDGAGIDIKKIENIAKDKNIISDADMKQFSEEDILDIIFMPGFSTKETVSNISGRGVGLDVVKENLSHLKGSISIKTHLNKGTSFILDVPLTLASERGLLIKVANQLCVIPSHAVHRVLVCPASDILQVEGTEAIILDKKTIPIRALSQVLHLTNETSFLQEKLSIAVIKKGHQHIALLVDDIVGEREIVIKPFHAPLTSVPCVSGGTLLESNQVIIVLNPMDLINYAFHPDMQGALSFQATTEEPLEKPHILVVDDSITTRTLEKNILESKNYQVTLAVNGKEAWDLLQKQPFSLIITDVSMPIMDGFTLTENIKKSEKLNELPVIIVTSLGSDSEKKRGIEVGANAYIVKSEFESGTLLEMVAQFI